MRQLKFRPTLNDLELRSLPSLILDLDTGTRPGVSLPNVSMWPYDFSYAHDLTITSGHGTLMAQRFVAAESALGRHDTFISQKVAGPNNLFDEQDIYDALEYDAQTLIPAWRHDHPGDSIALAMPMGGPDVFTFWQGVVGALQDLGRLGVTISVAAGGTANNNDAVTWFPSAAAQNGALNVLTVAASTPVEPDTAASPTAPLWTPDPNAALQSWSNYGASTVPIAIPCWYGTSEASILGAIALVAAMDNHPQPAGVSGQDYSAAIVHSVIAGATPDPSLTGLVSSGGQLVRLDASGPLVIVPTPVYPVVPVPKPVVKPVHVRPKPHAVVHHRPHPKPHSHSRPRQMVKFHK